MLRVVLIVLVIRMDFGAVILDLSEVAEKETDIDIDDTHSLRSLGFGFSIYIKEHRWYE